MSQRELSDAIEGWNAHLLYCRHCEKVDISKPVSLAGCCHKGAQLVKAYLEQCAKYGYRFERGSRLEREA